jgi:hypothetical protein
MRTGTKWGVLALAAVVLTGALTACTSGGNDPTTAPSTVVRTSVITETPDPSGSSAPIVPPISTGPTRSATASACPLLDQQAAANKVGMRLARITVLHSGGRLVGCRFFALQNSPLHQSEHLPGPHQPAVEIQTFRYPSARDAHNGFVRLSEKEGHNLEQADIVGHTRGLCFQTHFYPKDQGTDWACAFSKGNVVGVVRTVVTSPALNAILVARAIAAKV